MKEVQFFCERLQALLALAGGCAFTKYSEPTVKHYALLLVKPN